MSTTLNDSLRASLEKLLRDADAQGDNRDLYETAASQSEMVWAPQMQGIQQDATAKQGQLATQRQSLEEQTARTQAQLEEFFKEERQKLSNQSLARGLQHSSIALNLQEDAGKREGEALSDLFLSASTSRKSLDDAERSILADMQDALLMADYQKALDARTRFDALLSQRQKEQTDREQFEYQQQKDEAARLQSQSQFEAKMAAEARALQQAQAQFEAKMAQQSAATQNAAAKEANRANEAMLALYGKYPDVFGKVDAKGNVQAPTTTANGIDNLISTLPNANAATLGAMYDFIMGDGFLNIFGKDGQKKALTAWQSEMAKRERLEGLQRVAPDQR